MSTLGTISLDNHGENEPWWLTQSIKMRSRGTSGGIWGVSRLQECLCWAKSFFSSLGTTWSIPGPILVLIWFGKGGGKKHASSYIINITCAKTRPRKSSRQKHGIVIDVWCKNSEASSGGNISPAWYLLQVKMCQWLAKGIENEIRMIPNLL